MNTQEQIQFGTWVSADPGPLPACPLERAAVVEILRENLRYSTWDLNWRASWLKLAGFWNVQPHETLS